MCASTANRMQRGLMAIVLTLSLFLMKFQPELMVIGFGIGEILMVFVILMVAVWAIFDFCPSLWILKKVLKEDS